MKTMKKRIVVAVALAMMLVGSAVPAFAFDPSTTSTSGSSVNVTSIQATSGVMSMMSVPVRCGSDC